MPNFFQRFIAAVDREFERRVQRASHPDDEAPAAHAVEEWDEDEVEIANVPRGTSLSNLQTNSKSE